MTTVAAPAKINLWLRVGDLRPDGFHWLDTLFCALDLADTVTLEPAAEGGVRLHLDHAPPLLSLPDLGPAEANLAVKAANLAIAQGRLPRGLSIHLVKRIPAGGGLGGGSSDAAGVLRCLAELHPDAFSPGTLHRLGSSLGSDVPFFLAGSPLARGLGRGEDLMPVAGLPARPVVLVLPPFHISTAAAYGWLDQDRDQGLVPPPPQTAVPVLEELDWAAVESLAHNDFEPVVFRRHPDLERIRDSLVRLGARTALLAGSGSTLFGLFDHDDDAAQAARSLQRLAPGVTTLVARTATR